MNLTTSFCRLIRSSHRGFGGDQIGEQKLVGIAHEKSRPVLLTAVMREWKAPVAWTPDYLDASVGEVEVPLTHSLIQPAGTIACRDLFRRIRAARHGEGPVLLPAHGPSRHPKAGCLRLDLSPLPPFLTPELGANDWFLWLGPAGAGSSWHLARENVLLAQIFGRRLYRLVPPFLEPAAAIVVVVAPGQALFVRVGWRRAVRALDTAATVGLTNFIFPNQFAWEKP